MMLSRACGFSLIELIIVVGIMAILSSIAIPAWRNYLLATHRLDATGALLHLAARQAQFRLTHQRYAAADELANAPPLGLGIDPLPGHRYRLEISSDARGYTATATTLPYGGQQHDQDCYLFGINAADRRWAQATDGRDTTTKCWRTQE